MISVVTFDKKIEEIMPLKIMMKDIAAYVSEDEWKFAFCKTVKEFDVFLASKPLVDINCFDVTVDRAMDILYSFRQEYDTTLLVLIADASISPMDLLKPGVRPDSLLLRPLESPLTKRLLHDVFAGVAENIQNSEGVKSYVIDSKEGKTSIPYKDIYYIEAREKKIFIRTMNEEFGFYETIENIQEELPECFERCHRSFIVNKDKIKKIMLSQSLIELTENFDVPLSRSYKPLFKNYGK